MGERPPVPCETCGGAVPGGARFCPSCGTRLSPAVSGAGAGDGEHRQITVMFCDLVGSTTLSAMLDPEDLRDVLRAFQKIAAEEVEGRHGMIAGYYGDGILAYFGYPRASEDAAVRGAEAALRIAARTAALEVAEPSGRTVRIASRIALNTGRVLVGEMGSGEARDPHAITGVVPNLAARLQGIAGEDEVVTSEATARLIERDFRLEPMGAHTLKGLAEPVQAFRLLGPLQASSVTAGSRRPFVGRRQELAVLAGAWDGARAGKAVRITVVAEPGAGKSSLAAAFAGAIGIDPARTVEFAGTVAGRHTPFAAVRQAVVRRLASAGAGEPAAARRTLGAWFADAGPEAKAHVETLLALWRRDADEAGERRRAVFEALDALVTGLPSPVLLLLEDAHWIDPSTVELVERVTDAADRSILVLALTRPEGGADWSRLADEVVTLGPLSADGCRALAEEVAGCRVEASLARRIEAATDGLPLYVEEFTKALLGSGLVHERRGTLRAVDGAVRIDTPGTLLDLITSRLDALGHAKTIAQVASVLGRRFDRDALAAVHEGKRAEVDLALDRLGAAGIVTAEEDGAVAFRHALFQQAAYESLLKGQRRRLHGRTLAHLKGEPARWARVPPETAGYHLEACGETLAAAGRYAEAGLAANRASASFEAAAHFRKACDLLAAAEGGDDLAVARLRAQVLLAGALLSSRGPGAPETRAAYDEARALAESAPESEWHLAAYWGWWRVSDTFATMAKRARHLMEASRRMKGEEFRLQAMHCAWANAFAMGEFDLSLETARAGLALYETEGFAHQRTLYGGHDCKVCALGETGLTTWLQGAGDAAAAHVDEALAHAEAIGHVGSLVHALDIAVMLHHYRRDGAAVARHAARLGALGIDHDLEEYRAKGEIFTGWRLVDAGEVRGGLARIEAGFAVMQEVCTPEDFPVYECMRAEALRTLGDHDAALAALAGGRAVIVEQGVSFWAAEIARQEAETEMARPEGDGAVVAARLAEAREIAARQGALALELRAALSALCFARRTGGAGAEREEVERVLSRFDPAATGRDLEDARAALALPALP